MSAQKNTTKKPKAKKAGKRLRPGELDKLVLAHMRSDKEDLPLTASAIGKAIGRSSGAVANCLPKRKPRAYTLKEK